MGFDFALVVCMVLSPVVLSLIVAGVSGCVVGFDLVCLA